MRPRQIVACAEMELQSLVRARTHDQLAETTLRETRARIFRR